MLVNFIKNCQTFFQSVCIILHPPVMYESSYSLTYINTWYCQSFGFLSLTGCVVVSHLGLFCISLTRKDVKTFSWAYWALKYLLLWNACIIFCPYLNSVSLHYWSVGVLYIFWIEIFCISNIMPAIVCFSYFINVFWWMEVLNFDKIHIIIFSCRVSSFCILLKKSLPIP